MHALGRVQRAQSLQNELQSPILVQLVALGFGIWITRAGDSDERVSERNRT